MQFALRIYFKTINLKTVSDLRCIIRRSFQYLWIKCSPKCFTCHVIILSHVRFAYRISVFSLINLNSLTLCHTLTIPEHMSTLAGVSGCSRYSIFYFRSNVLFVCLFSFDHCIVCPSSIYGFWLLLWYLHTSWFILVI